MFCFYYAITSPNFETYDRICQQRLKPLSRRLTPLAQIYLPTTSHYLFPRLSSRKGVFLIQTPPLAGYDDFKMAMMRISPIKHSVPWSSPLQQQLGTSSFRQKMLWITTSRPYSVIKSMMTIYFLVLWKISGLAGLEVKKRDDKNSTLIPKLRYLLYFLYRVGFNRRLLWKPF